MSRHRRGHWGRVILLVPMLAGIFSWYAVREPFRYNGLVITTVVYVIIWMLLFGPHRRRRRHHSDLGALAPRNMRAAYRKRRADAGLARSNPISAQVRRKVLAADRHRCVACGARGNLQIDHYYPYSLGGRATIWNCFVLCGYDNEVKLNYWRGRDRDGYEHYRAEKRNPMVLARAAEILAAERRRRHNPLRWARALAA